MPSLRTILRVLAPALAALLVSAADVAHAGPVEDATRQLTVAEGELGGLRAERARLEAELDGLAGRIEARKAQGTKLLGDAELERLLGESQRLADLLARLSRAEEAASAKRAAAAEALLASYDAAIADARAWAAKNRGDLSRLHELKARRERVRQELLSRLGGPARAPAAFARPTDDPEELRARADLLRDDRDRVAKRLAEVEKRLAEVREEAEVERELRDFVADSDLFDESDRTVRVTRSGGSNKTCATPPPAPRGGPAATADGGAAPPAGNDREGAGGGEDTDSPPAAGTDPNLAGDPPTPDFAGSEDGEAAAGGRAPIAYEGRAADLLESPEALPGAEASPLAPLPPSSGTLAASPEDLRRAPLPGLTGDESLEELKRKKAQLERMAGTLERRASALDAEAKRLGDGR